MEQNLEHEEVVETTETEETPEVTAEDAPTSNLEAELEESQNNYLRLAAEYDNFRKRSVKEKEALYTDLRADTVGKFLPVFDNLERALAQETADEAFKKGVEMTMNGLLEVFDKLGMKAYGEVGETFDPNLHNAVMHTEDENLGENVLSTVFQKGFAIGDKVVRFAMVTVAN
ncbi:MAG: nucleotide exchange factor GrpE [Eubacteriales bacterium]